MLLVFLGNIHDIGLTNAKLLPIASFTSPSFNIETSDEHNSFLTICIQVNGKC